MKEKVIELTEQVIDLNKDNIRKAIEIGASYIKPCRDGKIRCFGPSMGYGEFVDLTSEEYEVYQKISLLRKEEKLERLDKEVEKLVG